MIICPLCRSENSHLAVICKSCGSFVQAKVDTLNLFTTVWELVESPRTAFHKIAIASHKNYVFVLASLTGVGFAFSLMWLFEIGNTNASLLDLLSAGFLFGPMMGILGLILITSVQKIIERIFRLHAGYKNALAVITYATVPIVFSVIFILPVEILTFGKFFFSSNPSPVLLNPISYIIVLGLDGICIVWFLTLYVIGTKVLYDVRVYYAALITGMTLAVFVGILFLGVSVVIQGYEEPPLDKYFAGVLQQPEGLENG